MRILVTGGTGFIGFRTAAYLARNGHDVVATWHAKKPVQPPSDIDGLEFAALDVTDRKSTCSMIGSGEFDGIVHTAAAIDAGDKLEALPRLIDSNIGAAGNLVEAASRGGCPRIVFTSSIAVYGSANSPNNGFSENSFAPDTLYGWSKRSAEEIFDLASARIPGFSAVSLRLAGVHGLGRDGGALYSFVNAAFSNAPIKIAEPASRFRWSFIDDVLQGVDRALTSDLSAQHHIVNLASSDTFTLLELVQQIREVAGSQCAIEANAEGQERCSVLNIDRARQLLGFKPTSLEDFLPCYISGLRNK